MSDLKTFQCSYPNCNFVTSIHADEVVDGKWYCPGHRMNRVMRPDAGDDLKLKPAPDGGRCAPDEITGKIVVHLTDEQIDDLKVLLDKPRTGGVISGPVPQWAPAQGTHHNALMYGKKCKELETALELSREALDCAEYAFQFISNKGCDCPRKTEADPHRPLCQVHAAQNALDSIRAKLGDS